MLLIGVITLGGLGITPEIITPSDVDWGNNPRWFRELQDVRVVLVTLHSTPPICAGRTGSEFWSDRHGIGDLILG